MCLRFGFPSDNGNCVNHPIVGLAKNGPNLLLGLKQDLTLVIQAAENSNLGSLESVILSKAADSGEACRVQVLDFHEIAERSS